MYGEVGGWSDAIPWCRCCPIDGILYQSEGFGLGFELCVMDRIQGLTFPYGFAEFGGWLSVTVYVYGPKERFEGFLFNVLPDKAHRGYGYRGQASEH